MPARRPASWLLAFALALAALTGFGTPVAAAPAPQASAPAAKTTKAPAKPAAKATPKPAAKPATPAKAPVKPAAKPVTKPNPGSSAAARPVSPARPAKSVADQAAAAFRTGAAAYARNQMLQAAEAFQQVVTLQTTNADAFYYLGLSYYGLGQHDLAVAAFSEARLYYPKPKGEVLFGMGLAHYALGALPQARDDFAAVAATDAGAELKTNAGTWMQVLDATLTQRANEQALAQDLRFREGIERYEQGRFLEASQAFDATLQQFPRSSTIYYYLGACNYQLNRFDDAVKAFQSVIQFDPGSQQAKDAQLFIDSIRGRQQSRAGRPFSFFASLGSGYDTNVSFGPTTSALPDVTSQMQLSAAYRFSPNVRAQYALWAGNNLGAVPGSTLGMTSRDFNMVGHTGSLLWDWPVSRMLAMAGDYQFSWYFLGSNSFLMAHRFTPRLQLAWNQNLASSLYGVVETAQYPTVSQRSSINGGLGTSTVWQTAALPGVLFSGGYDLMNVAAADDAINESIGRLDDGTTYAVRSRLAYSYLSHGPYLAVDAHFWQTSVRLSSRLSWLNFGKPDVYQISYFQADKALPPSLETVKTRSDQLLQLSLDVNQPIWNDLAAVLQATYWLNASNITEKDYGDRSYRKGQVLLNLVYSF
jgi:tetratricopeptide (TPR) repeat protein